MDTEEIKPQLYHSCTMNHDEERPKKKMKKDLGFLLWETQLTTGRYQEEMEKTQTLNSYVERLREDKVFIYCKTLKCMEDSVREYHAHCDACDTCRPSKDSAENLCQDGEYLRQRLAYWSESVPETHLASKMTGAEGMVCRAFLLQSPPKDKVSEWAIDEYGAKVYRQVSDWLEAVDRHLAAMRKFEDHIADCDAGCASQRGVYEMLCRVGFDINKEVQTLFATRVEEREKLEKFRSIQLLADTTYDIIKATNKNS